MNAPRRPTETAVPEGLDDVTDAVLAEVPAALDALADLVTVPSISVSPEHAGEVRRSAEDTAGLIADAGLEHVRLLELDGVHPYVTGSWLHAGEDAPTVLLYAHHDVQPVGTPDRWTSPAFSPEVRDGRLYGRGTSDDKGGILAHLAAIRGWLAARGSLPVNVHVLVEGEEEIGSPHLTEFLEHYADELASDVVVVADVVNHQLGWPGLTTALRGLGRAVVTVRTLEQPVHSGLWGGPVPDALTALTHLLASLHDEGGEIAVAGYCDDVRPLDDEERAALAELDEDPDALRTEVRMLDGVAFMGDPDRSLLERLWSRPTITPTGVDAPGLEAAANTLLSQASAKLSCRMAPGQDPDRAMEALRTHLQANAPWGAHVELDVIGTTPAWSMRAEGPAVDAADAALGAAFGRGPARIGCGGSIPFVGPLSETFSGAPCLLIGVQDPASNAHGEDESLHLDDFTKACLGEAYLLAELARLVPRRER